MQKATEAGWNLLVTFAHPGLASTNNQTNFGGGRQGTWLGWFLERKVYRAKKDEDAMKLWKLSEQCTTLINTTQFYLLPCHPHNYICNKRIAHH